MSYLTERQAIVDRFVANSTIPTIDWSDFGDLELFDEDEFLPPEVDVDVPANSIWARPTQLGVPGAIPPIRGVTRPGPMGLGATAPNYREGRIVIQHFAPRGYGERDLDQYVDETRGIFHRARFSPVVCRDADAPQKIDTEGNWLQVNQAFEYYVIEVI